MSTSTGQSAAPADTFATGSKPEVRTYTLNRLRRIAEEALARGDYHTALQAIRQMQMQVGDAA